jgi:hypothetical protein
LIFSTQEGFERSHHSSRIRLPKNRISGDQNIGTGLRQRAGIVQIHSAVYFDPKVKALKLSVLG